MSAGMDFTMWLCSGRVWSAGFPQYGQLGDGSDHMFNASDSEQGLGNPRGRGCIVWLCVGAVQVEAEVAFVIMLIPWWIAGTEGITGTCPLPVQQAGEYSRGARAVKRCAAS